MHMNCQRRIILRVGQCVPDSMTLSKGHDVFELCMETRNHYELIEMYPGSSGVFVYLVFSIDLLPAYEL